MHFLQLSISHHLCLTRFSCNLVAESFPPMWFLDQLCLFRHSSGFPHGHVVSSKMLQSGWGLQVTSGCWLPLWWAPFAKTDTKTGSIALNCPFNTVQRSFFQCVLFPPRTNSPQDPVWAAKQLQIHLASTDTTESRLCSFFLIDFY